MVPLNPRAAARQYETGKVYHLDHREERSGVSHRHYFASLHDAWMQLPEAIADRFPTAEHLRKYALIRCGYRDERIFVTDSEDKAREIARFIRPMDELAVVSVNECAVVVWTAKSQSTRAMGKKEFQASKTAVLDYVWSLCGVTREQGSAEVGRAA